MLPRFGGPVPSKYLEDPDRLVRYVPWGKLIKDDDEKVIGVIGAAFALRSGEEYLSATWCEYFDGSSDQTLRCAVGAIRNSELKPSSKGHFAVAEVKAAAFMVVSLGFFTYRDQLPLRQFAGPVDPALRRWLEDTFQSIVDG